MSANFLSLPSELRNKIYEQLLVLEEPIACPTQQRLKQSQLGALSPRLLRANRAIHLAARSMLYAQNRFNFTCCTSENVASFFEQIGSDNASYIVHACIRFPITLEDDSVRILAKIQSDCTNLGTLTTSLHDTNTEALALVDACVRAISSLQEVIVDVHEDSLSDHIQREIKNHGWTVKEKASSLDLSYHFIRGENDHGPEAFTSAFFNLPLHPEKYDECYIGSYTFRITPSAVLVIYEVLLYGQIAKMPPVEYQIFDTLPINNVSKAQLTPIFGQQPRARREDSSLTKEEWNEKFRHPT